jgi:hypothetical protein
MPANPDRRNRAVAHQSAGAGGMKKPRAQSARRTRRRADRAKPGLRGRDPASASFSTLRQPVSPAGRTGALCRTAGVRLPAFSNISPRGTGALQKLAVMEFPGAKRNGARSFSTHCALNADQQQRPTTFCALPRPASAMTKDELRRSCRRRSRYCPPDPQHRRNCHAGGMSRNRDARR